jgi:hypothetical protein
MWLSVEKTKSLESEGQNGLEEKAKTEPTGVRIFIITERELIGAWNK